MDVLWPLIVVMAVGLVLAAGLAWGPRWVRGVRVYHRSFWCPFRGRSVEVDFVESAWSGKAADVSACSIFVPPTHVRCDKACLDLGAFPAKREAGVEVSR